MTTRQRLAREWLWLVVGLALGLALGAAVGVYEHNHAVTDWLGGRLPLPPSDHAVVWARTWQGALVGAVAVGAIRMTVWSLKVARTPA